MGRNLKIEIYWHNPPNDCATIRKTLDGREYDRKIGPQSLLTTFEASKVLKCTPDYIYRLIERGKLKTYPHNKKIYIKMKDLLDYKKNKRPPGRPKKEAFLI